MLAALVLRARSSSAPQTRRHFRGAPLVLQCLCPLFRVFLTFHRAHAAWSSTVAYRHQTALDSPWISHLLTPAISHQKPRVVSLVASASFPHWTLWVPTTQGTHVVLWLSRHHQEAFCGTLYKWLILNKDLPLAERYALWRSLYIFIMQFLKEMYVDGFLCGNLLQKNSGRLYISISWIWPRSNQRLQLGIT